MRISETIEERAGEEWIGSVHLSAIGSTDTTDEPVTLADLVDALDGWDSPTDGALDAAVEAVSDAEIIAAIEAYRAEHPEADEVHVYLSAATTEPPAPRSPEPSPDPIAEPPAPASEPALPENVETFLRAGLAAAKAGDLTAWYAAFRALRDGASAPWEAMGRTELYQLHAARFMRVPGKGGVVERNRGGDIVFEWVPPEPPEPIPEPDDGFERSFMVGNGGVDGEYRRLKTALPLALAHGEGLTRLLEAPESEPLWSELTYQEMNIVDDGITLDMRARWPRSPAKRSRRWEPSKRMRAAWAAYAAG